MGILLPGSRYHLQVQALLEPFKGLLMSVFFVAVGMSIDLGAIGARPGAFARDAAIIVLLKILAMGVVGWLFGLGRAVTVRVSFLIAQGGEFGFVLFGSARALGVLNDASFVTGIGVISVSMLVTPLLLRLGEAIAHRWERTRATTPEDLKVPAADGVAPRVIIGGYGRVGHTVAAVLARSSIPFLAVDTDPARVARGESDGFPCVLRRHRGPGAVGGDRRRTREPGGADDRPGASRAPGRHAAAQRLAPTPGDRSCPGPRGERQTARGRCDPSVPGGG
jgi:glutathione-regulated potassium-efflux system protein KefB